MKISKVIRRAAPAVAATSLLLIGTAVPSQADHTHVKVVGNGECIVLAEGSGESHVDLPTAVFSNPNVDIAEADGLTHPLHLLVHRGVPGDHASLYVLGSAAASAACPGEPLNH